MQSARMNPAKIEELIAQGQTLIKLACLDKAYATFNEAAIHAENFLKEGGTTDYRASAYYHRGLASYAKKKFIEFYPQPSKMTDLENDFELALKIDPDLKNSIEKDKFIMEQVFGNFLKNGTLTIEGMFRRAIKTWQVKVFFDNGIQFYSKEDYSTAANHFSNAIQHDTQNALAYIYLGLCLFKLKNPLDAEKNLFDGIKKLILTSELREIKNPISMDVVSALIELQSHFISKHDSRPDIVKKTEEMKANLANSAELLLERARLWNALSLNIKASQDLQFAIFLIQSRLYKKGEDNQFLLPTLYGELAIAFVNLDKADLQNALKRLFNYEFDAKAPTCEIAKAIAKIKGFMSLNQLKEAKEEISSTLRFYSMGIRISVSEKSALFKLCLTLNESFQNKKQARAEAKKDKDKDKDKEQKKDIAYPPRAAKPAETPKADEAKQPPKSKKQKKKEKKEKKAAKAATKTKADKIEKINASEQKSASEQKDTESKETVSAEISKAKSTPLPGLEIPQYIKATIEKFKKNHIRAHFGGGFLRYLIRKAKGLPTISYEMDRDFIIGVANFPATEELQKKYLAHVLQCDEKSITKTGPSFHIKLDDEETIDVRISDALSNFEVDEYQALAAHAKTVDTTQGALFSDGEFLYDPLSWTEPKRSGLQALLESKLELVNDLIDPIVVYRLIYHYGLGEGEIAPADMAKIKEKTKEFFTVLDPAITNHWLNKMLCKGKGVKNFQMLQGLETIPKLLPAIVDRRVKPEMILRALQNADQCYTSKHATEEKETKSRPQRSVDLDTIFASWIDTIAVSVKGLTSDKISQNNPLFKCNFEYNHHNPELFIRKINRYEKAGKETPKFIQTEIDKFIRKTHEKVFNFFCTRHAQKNFMQNPVISAFLMQHFQDLTILLTGPQLKLFISHLQKLDKAQVDYKLERLYAFWIIAIAEITKKDRDIIINNNPFFREKFPSSCSNHFGFFAQAEEIFNFTAREVGLISAPSFESSTHRVHHSLPVLAPAPLPTTPTGIEPNLPQVTGVAPKSQELKQQSLNAHLVALQRRVI